MKKLISCVLVIFILLINVVPCFAANPTLSVGVSNYYVNRGDTITVNINFSADSALGTLGFTVNFNPDEFSYVAGTAKSSGMFGDNETITPSNSGQITFRGVATESVTAGGTVLSFQLQSIKNGGVVSLSVTESVDIEGNPVSVTRSSVKLNCGHKFIKWTVTQEPTCMIYGKEEGVCTGENCNHSETREIDTVAHTYSESKVITEPTCTKTGVKIGTCTVCKQEGENAKSVIPALGHDYSDWKVTKEPTDTTLGIKERTCKICKENETQMVSSMGSLEDEPTSDEFPTDEPITDQPTVPTTEPDYNNYYEIETEPTTENNGILGKLFGDNVKGSNVALVAITGLTVLIVGFLIAYLVLLRKKK